MKEIIEVLKKCLNKGNCTQCEYGKYGKQMRGVKMGYHVCPLCGANLDPGEHCECEKEKEQNGQAGIERRERRESI